MNGEARQEARERVQRELGLAREATDARIGELDPVRRARLWARIDEARSEEPQAWFDLSWRAWALVAAATACLVLVAVQGTRVEGPKLRHGVLRAGVAELARGDQLPAGELVTAVESSRIETEWMVLEVEAGARLALNEPRVVAVEAGSVRVSAIGAAEVVVVTPEARLSSVGGRVGVRREEGRTRAEVESGQVEIARKGRRSEVLRAGQFAVISAVESRAEAAPSKPSPMSEPPVTEPPVTEPPVTELTVIAESPAVQRPVAEPPAVEQPVEQPEDSARRESAATPAQADPATPVESARRVEEGRAWISRDAPRARAIAEDVLGTAPPPQVRISATMLLADALRLEGRREEAAAAYGRVVADRAGGSFREEAMLRQAQLFGELGRRAEALALLDDAERTIATRLLRPERIALAANLCLEQGRAEEAAARLERVAGDRARTLQLTRLRVARKVSAETAGKLLQPVLGGGDPELAHEAAKILDRVR